MVEIPRGRDGREVLRVQFTEARTQDGKSIAWHSIREFYRDTDGKWKPGKKGITLRGRELRPVVDALTKAVSVTPHSWSGASQVEQNGVVDVSELARAAGFRPNGAPQ